MKQSKYSKRRPANGKAYLPPVKHKDDKPTMVLLNPLHNEVKEYDIGFFIDDMRVLDTVNLPKAKRWVTIRSYHDIDEAVEEALKDESIKTVCASFDHYMYDTNDPRACRMPDGNDCLFCFADVVTDRKLRVDVGGHSSDPSKNTEKEDLWKKHFSECGSTFHFNQSY